MKYLKVIGLLSIMLVLGSAVAQKSEVKPSSKSSSKEGKKSKPDPNYEKYLSGGSRAISNHAITVNVISPLWGFAEVGYQRKLARHFLGEAGFGVGVMSSSMYTSDDFYTGDMISDKGTFLVGSYAKDINHPKFETYGMLSYCLTGPLVNYNYGFGIYARYLSIGIDWTPGKNEKGTFNSFGYGLAMHSQTMIAGRIGFGWCVGIGVENSTIKNAYYFDADTGESAHKDIKGAGVGFGYIGQLKLNIIL